MNNKYMNAGCLIMAILFVVFWQNPIAASICLLASGLYAIANSSNPIVSVKADQSSNIAGSASSSKITIEE